MKREILYYFMRERIKKINQLIKKELSNIIIKEIEFPEDAWVTLTRIESSVDLRQCRAYISVMPEDKIKTILKILDSQIYNLQQKLNKRLNMRPIPKIYFVGEEETVRAGRVEEILEKIKQEK